MQDLSGKVAVVTGGATGIGLALARRFAQEKMKIVIADIQKPLLRDAFAVLRGDGAEVLAVHTDVSQAEEVEDLARQTFEQFGGAHLVCNNAAVLTGGLSWQHHLNDWEWALGVNVWGVIHGIRAFVPRLIQQGQPAHILNTVSIAGVMAHPYLGIYTTTKHAIMGLSKTLAVELQLERPDIGVSVLCPGYAATDLTTNERTRPEGLALGEHDRIPRVQGMIAEGARQSAQESMPADQVAVRAVAGIRNGDFCILTQDEHRAELRRRTERLLTGHAPSTRRP